MYLLAQEIKSDSFLSEWNGKNGKFVRTFGMNTKRNKNEWRATWESIKQYIHTAINKPGIEFEVCVDNKCDLDHVEAETYEENLEKQKPFARTEIIDYVLDEANQSVDLIHEVQDDEFWGKLKEGIIKYVSPLIWPKSRDSIKVSGSGRNGLPIIDAYEWDFTHHAFLKNSPAFGDDVAVVKTMCEGENCDVSLLGGKLQAETTTANDSNLEHLQEIMLYKHKGHTHLIAASQCLKDILQKKKADGITIDDQALAIAYSECGESQKAKSSFKTCTCKAKQNSMSAEQDLKKENDDLKSKLKAMEDDKEKEKSYESKKARYAKLFAETKEEDREKMVAKLKAMEDKDELKAAEEVNEEMKKAKKGMSEDPEKERMKAQIEKLQAKEKTEMINEMAKYQKVNGLEGKKLSEYKGSLEASTFEEVETTYSHLEAPIKHMKANTQFNETEPEVEFNGTGDTTMLKGKTFEEIMEIQS